MTLVSNWLSEDVAKIAELKAKYSTLSKQQSTLANYAVDSGN